MAAAAVQHELLLGTHTSKGEQNYLMVATCVVPANTQVLQEQQPDDNEQQQQAVQQAAQRYDDDRKQLGGFGQQAAADVGKIEIKMKIKHEGEVNRYVVKCVMRLLLGGG